MFGLRFGRDTERRIVIVDIGSSSAAVGVLIVDKKGKSRLIASHRSFIPYEKRTKDQFAARMGSAIEEASSNVMKSLSLKYEQHTIPLTEMFVFFRAPWVDAQVTKLTKTFSEETKITKEHIDSLSKQAVSAEQKLLEAVVLRLEINGYSTPEAVGKSGHSLSVYALVSTVDKDLQKTAQQYVEKAFPHLETFWRSHTRALIYGVRELPKHPRNTLIIDISSEGSQLLVVRDGILEASTTFGTGVHSILERLGKSALPEETLGLLRMIEREQCTGDACDQLRSNIEKIEQEMVREFGEQLAALAGRSRLPQDAILFVHPDLAPWLSRFFSRLDFAQFTVPLQPFNVTELAAKDMKEWIEIENVSPDISILLAALLVHIEAYENQ